MILEFVDYRKKSTNKHIIVEDKHVTFVFGDIRIEGNIILDSIDSAYYLDMYEHWKFWNTLKRLHPDAVDLAIEYDAVNINCACPEFDTEEDLISWLSIISDYIIDTAEKLGWV